MHKTTPRNLALCVTVVSVSVLLAEYAVRYVFRDITTTSDNRSYFAITWKRANVTLNSLGYRERESDRAKPTGLCRIAFIGDSDREPG